MSNFPKYNGPSLKMGYTDATDLYVLHSIPMSEGYSVRVVGNPDQGAYEWLLEIGGKVEHSDCGYGDSDIALRDGLIKMHGLPNNLRDCLQLARTELHKAGHRNNSGALLQIDSALADN